MLFDSFRLAKQAILATAFFCLLAPQSKAAGSYAWTVGESNQGTVSARLATPPGFERVAVQPGSFAAWLRQLPVKTDGAPVKLYNGTLKPRQDAHAAVIDIDVGGRDLQQCADAIMRLRAEWLFATGRTADIAFNFTGGGRVPFSRYARGERPDESGKRWLAKGKRDDSYPSFRRYMDLVYAFAGTASLEAELNPADVSEIQIGDVFIKGGFPGHAVLVADIAENILTKSKRLLLVQSFMPAQEIHVLKNPANGDGSPWYSVPPGELVTPEWTFAAGSLRRWP